MITVVGLGIERGDLTQRGKKAIKSADYVFSRGKNRSANESAAVLFADCESFEELNEAIAAHLLAKEKESESVVYLVAGDGFSDGAVKILEQRTKVSVIAGVADTRGRSAQTSFVTLSAYDVDANTSYNTSLSHVIYQIDDKGLAGDVKLSLLDYYDPETQVTLTDKGVSKVLPLFEIDRERKYTCACLVVPPIPDFLVKKRFEINDLLKIMRRLTAPDGCPWDKAQTNESIRVNMIEEAYEAVDAIDSGDRENFIEELGDVLLQVVFHCDMAMREGNFDFNDVVSGVCDKLVFRHPHVFGQVKANDSDAALTSWEQAKAKEKHYETLCEQIDRLPEAFPSTLYLQKLVKKANKYGAAVTERDCMQSLQTALQNKDGVALLVNAVALVSLMGYDPEVELNRAAKRMANSAKQAEQNGTLDKWKETW